MVLESLRSEAGIHNVAAAERALLAVAYGTDDDSVMAKEPSTRTRIVVF